MHPLGVTHSSQLLGRQHTAGTQHLEGMASPFKPSQPPLHHASHHLVGPPHCRPDLACLEPGSSECFKGGPLHSPCPTSVPRVLGEAKATTSCKQPEDPSSSPKSSEASLFDLKQAPPSSESLSSTNCKMGRQPCQVLPSSKALSLDTTAPGKLHRTLGSCFRKLHKHPPETQKSNLKTLLFFFFLRISRNPFYSPTSPFLLPLFQISSEDQENAFGFRLGFWASWHSSSWKLPHLSLAAFSPAHTHLCPPSIALGHPEGSSSPACQRWGMGCRDSFQEANPSLVRTEIALGSGPNRDTMCGPVWASPSSSLGIGFPLKNEGEHCVGKALGLLGSALGTLRQKRTAG